MKREYPTIPAEAFQQSVEGAYYAKQFRWLYTNKRIGQIPDNSHLPVHTFWDIGVGDSTAIWFVREVGEEFHIIDYYENSGEGLRHYMKVLKDRGYEYGEHWGRTISRTANLLLMRSLAKSWRARATRLTANVFDELPRRTEGRDRHGY